MTHEREQPTGGEAETFDDVGDEAVQEDARAWEHPVARDGFVKEGGASDEVPAAPPSALSGGDTIDPQRPERGQHRDDSGDDDDDDDEGERRRRAGTYST